MFPVCAILSSRMTSHALDKDGNHLCIQPVLEYALCLQPHLSITSQLFGYQVDCCDSTLPVVKQPPFVSVPTSFPHSISSCEHFSSPLGTRTIGEEHNPIFWERVTVHIHVTFAITLSCHNCSISLLDFYCATL